MTLINYLRSRPRGTLRWLAEVIGVNQSDVSNWATGRRPVPPIRCVAIERATEGAVTRPELRPDDWHLIWPELAHAYERVATAVVDRAANCGAS
ncbi:transcriptional regulator [Ralstonia pseudosolanacearum]|uniref:transcriptional regulator n=1 Tax=Ralstonia pseudosolanacearum TaxID=1310165 RepID=UPI003CF5B1FF